MVVFLNLNKEFKAEKIILERVRPCCGRQGCKSSFPNVAYSVSKSYNLVSHPNPDPPLPLK